MPETTFYEKPYKISEIVGDHLPQTPALAKEFGDGIQGITRTYEFRAKFSADPLSIYWDMTRRFQGILPEDHRLVWTGYCVEANNVGGTNGDRIQVGWIIKAWFVAYQLPNMDKFIKLRES
jgi:hypothetical protein